MDRSAADPQSADSTPEISIIVPARNEEVSLGDCLQSLVRQRGVTFEIIVVDDGSADHTRQIAESFPGVRVISPRPLPSGWTGKNNAVIAGAAAATGEWLLFTDADTVHLPGSLARALAEAKREKADLLSYSPEQIVATFWERAVMPVVFAELATEYPPAKVREPNSGTVAANGQYILVRREAYERAGGHAEVATEILEDVALAKAFRRAGLRVYFRYGGDAVRARMYRNWAQLRDGWTKNLALLFPHPTRRASLLTAWWLVAWLLPLLIPTLWLFLRIRKANFSFANTLLATTVGVPVFAYLLLRSYRSHVGGTVSWKGRTYGAGSSKEGLPMATTANKSSGMVEPGLLRSDN
jgi:glycosyltransferase involved in cell wall biosynthesis